MLAPTLLRLGKWGVLLRLMLVGVGPAANGLGQSYASDPLAFDVSHQRIVARFGDSDVAAHFTVTNRSHSVVVIHDIVPSCGCSVAQFPAKPWSLPAGASGRFSVVTDVRGKRGSLLKTVIVQSSVGAQQLTYQVDIQESVTPAERALNQARAKDNRQAIFSGDCARCHAAPARGLLGRELYDAACGICHDATHRASMVPDLRSPNKPTPREYWLPWIAHGKPGTLMPGFSIQAGGILSGDQMESLASYCASEGFRRSAKPPR